MSLFDFLRREWPEVYDAAARAEAGAYPDPRTSCFYARRALEIAVAWAYKHDASLRLPYQDNLSALIHEPSFKQAAGEAVFSKARVIVTLGNRAVHSHRAISPNDSAAAVRELFHVAYWFARTYSRVSLLLLNLQLTVLKHEPGFERLRNQVMEIAGALGEKDAIPMVHAQMPLLLGLQTEEWWQDVTVPMLEGVQRHVRTLVQFIDKRSRKPLYTDFEDLLGPETGTDVPGLGGVADLEKFRAKARAFLRAHLDHVAIQKLRLNKALTATDLSELERIEFVDMIVNHLTEHGLMEAALLYESPFTDLTPHGPNGLFSTGQVDELMATLASVRATAVAA